MSIGENIKKYREDLNISQRKLAKLSGITGQMVSRIENNLNNPSIDTLNKIAVALGVSVNELMEDKKLESDLGTRILECRKKKGLTQIQLAQKINKSESTIQKYEANVVRPNIAIIDLLAKVLGTTSQYLTYGIGECQVKDDIALIQEAIDNIEKLILQEGYRDNLDYQKGRLDGLRLAINLLSNKGE